MKLEVKVEGMKELEQEMAKFLQEMEDDLQGGTDDAANMVAGMIRAAAPYPRFKQAVTTKQLPRRADKPQVTMVGLDYNIAPDAHLTEFGTAERFHASGKSVGAMPANPFFRRTIDSAKSAIKAAIAAKAGAPIRRR